MATTAQAIPKLDVVSIIPINLQLNLVQVCGNSDSSCLVFPTAIATRDPPRQTARGFAERSLPNQVTSRPSMAPRIDFIGDEALATAKTPGYSVYYSIQHNMIDN
ncbi:hypothetical protein H2248_003291 [Termitomyces sp. 'cryptogamus']|nr:hypothetical protein H2248_003291 [Termitomyces sp. 'cryptogamus']